MHFKTKLKKVFCGAMVGATLLISTGVAVSAETTNFNITVTKSGVGQDDISKRTAKAGGGSYENRFYVTPTSFNGRRGTISVTSTQLHGTVTSNSISCGSGSLTGKSATYSSYAPSGQYYFLRGKFVASIDGTRLNVHGRYTA